jgi:hypothetical protein
MTRIAVAAFVLIVAVPLLLDPTDSDASRAPTTAPTWHDTLTRRAGQGVFPTEGCLMARNLALLGSRLEGRHSYLFVDLVLSVRARLAISR